MFAVKLCSVQSKIYDLIQPSILDNSCLNSPTSKQNAPAWFHQPIIVETNVSVSWLMASHVNYDGVCP
jgi:hypothetical protein